LAASPWSSSQSPIALTVGRFAYAFATGECIGLAIGLPMANGECKAAAAAAAAAAVAVAAAAAVAAAGAAGADGADAGADGADAAALPFR